MYFYSNDRDFEFYFNLKRCEICFQIFCFFWKIGYTWGVRILALIFQMGKARNNYPANNVDAFEDQNHWEIQSIHCPHLRRLIQQSRKPSMYWADFSKNIRIVISKFLMKCAIFLTTFFLAVIWGISTTQHQISP